MHHLNAFVSITGAAAKLWRHLRSVTLALRGTWTTTWTHTDKWFLGDKKVTIRRTWNLSTPEYSSILWGMQQPGLWTSNPFDPAVSYNIFFEGESRAGPVYSRRWRSRQPPARPGAKPDLNMEQNYWRIESNFDLWLVSRTTEWWRFWVLLPGAAFIALSRWFLLVVDNFGFVNTQVLCGHVMPFVCNLIYCYLLTELSDHWWCDSPQ